MQKITEQPITAINQKKFSPNYMEEIECRINFLEAPCIMKSMSTETNHLEFKINLQHNSLFQTMCLRQKV